MINTNEISPKQALEALKALVGTNLTAMLWGEPGQGKSSLVAQLAQSLNAPLWDVRLAQKTAADLGGLPALDLEKKTTVFYLPDFIMEIPQDGPSFLFLDELPGADEQTRIAAYSLILDRSIGKYKLPDGCIIIAAGNRPEDGAISCDFGTALNDRLVHLVVRTDPQSWVEWAIDAGIHPSIIAYVKCRPEMLNGKGVKAVNAEDAITPTPRSWEHISRILFQDGVSKQVARILIEGKVGSAIGAEFALYQDELKNLPSIDELLKAKTPQDAVNMIPPSISCMWAAVYGLGSHARQQPSMAIKAFEIARAIKEVTNKKNGIPYAEIAAHGAFTVFRAASQAGGASITKLCQSQQFKDWTEDYRKLVGQI